MIRQILKVEQKSSLNFWKSLGDTKKAIYLLLLFFFMMLVLPGVFMILSGLVLGVAEEALGRLLFLLSLAGLILVTLISVNFVIKDMILDRSVEQFMTFPIAPKELFTAKFIKHMILYGLSLMLPAGLLIGFFMTSRFGEWVLLPIHILYFSFIGLLGLMLAYIFIFTTVNILPLRRVNEILAFIGGLAFLAIYGFAFAGGGALGGVLSGMPDTSFIFEGFLYRFEGMKAFELLALMALILFLLFLMTRRVVLRALHGGWFIERGATGTRKGRSAVRSHVSALVQKDMRLTFRNYRELSVLLPFYLLPVLLIFAFGTSRSDREGGMAFDGTQLLTVSISGALIISLFVGAYNTARDAEYFEFLKMHPLGGMAIARAKYVFNIITIAPVFMVMVTVAWFFSSSGVEVLLYSLAFILLTSMAMVPVGMLIGSIEPVVSRKNPTRRLDTASNIIITVVMVVTFSLTRLVAGWLDAAGGRLNIVLVVLFVLALISLLIVKRMGVRYDRGFKITYKD